MEKKNVTIQTNTSKKRRLDQRSFPCQFYEEKGLMIYVLDDTKRDLAHKRFNLTAGCRIIDDGITYFIVDVKYSPAPKHPYIIVDPKITIFQ